MKVALSIETEQAIGRIAGRLETTSPNSRTTASAFVNQLVLYFERTAREADLKRLGASLVPKSVREKLQMDSLRELAEAMGEDYIQKLRKRAERRKTPVKRPLSADSNGLS